MVRARGCPAQAGGRRTRRGSRGARRGVRRELQRRPTADALPGEGAFTRYQNRVPGRGDGVGGPRDGQGDAGRHRGPVRDAHDPDHRAPHQHHHRERQGGVPGAG